MKEREIERGSLFVATQQDGIYRYHLTCVLEGDEVVPVYPYTFPYYHGVPEPANFPPHWRGPRVLPSMGQVNEATAGVWCDGGGSGGEARGEAAESGGASCALA